MSWNDLIFAIGDFISGTFEVLKIGENYVNWFYIAVIFVILVGWLAMQAKYNKEAEQTGGLK